MDPLVSVIVPVYNVYPYLHEAIDSVINQTYTNLEIILINDGSTDGSGEICDEYAERDSRIRVIHQDNKGLSAARNIGLENMTGEVLAFLDPDDAFQYSFIEKTLAALQNEDADMVLCKYDIQYTTAHMKTTSSKKTQPLIAPGVYKRNDVLSSLVNLIINVSVWNKLYRRELWNSIRFHEGHVCEDHEVIFKICSLCEKICVLPDSLYNHRKRPGSITAVHSLNNLNDALLAYIRTESFVRDSTPLLFSCEQLAAFERKHIKRLLSLYPRTRHVEGESKRDYRAGLRKQIIEIVERCGIRGSGLRVRTAYWMLLKCPWLYDISYPCYSVVRRAVFKVFGR
ncbi:MAG: glycosyltransferase family 2 protein [Clostridiales bacterium]|nr:glycosyltransferase family 2 protein [Clostridiales bacterium]